MTRQIVVQIFQLSNYNKITGEKLLQELLATPQLHTPFATPRHGRAEFRFAEIREPHL